MIMRFGEKDKMNKHAQSAMLYQKCQWDLENPAFSDQSFYLITYFFPNFQSTPS